MSQQIALMTKRLIVPHVLDIPLGENMQRMMVMDFLVSLLKRMAMRTLLPVVKNPLQAVLQAQILPRLAMMMAVLSAISNMYLSTMIYMRLDSMKILSS